MRQRCGSLIVHAGKLHSVNLVKILLEVTTRQQQNEIHLPWEQFHDVLKPWEVKVVQFTITNSANSTVKCVEDVDMYARHSPQTLLQLGHWPAHVSKAWGVRIVGVNCKLITFSVLIAQAMASTDMCNEGAMTMSIPIGGTAIWLVKQQSDWWNSNLIGGTAIWLVPHNSANMLHSLAQFPAKVSRPYLLRG